MITTGAQIRSARAMLGPRSEDLAGDASADVRGIALAALAKEKLAEAEALKLETYLNRKAGDLRRGPERGRLDGLLVELLTLRQARHDVSARGTGSRWPRPGS